MGPLTRTLCRSSFVVEAIEALLASAKERVERLEVVEAVIVVRIGPSTTPTLFAGQSRRA
jgi:hypothetical protein